MTYRIRLAPTAARQLQDLHPAGRRRIRAAIEPLADEPRHPSATRLVGGEGEWRIVRDGCRVIYEIDDRALLVLGVGIERRPDAYRRD